MKNYFFAVILTLMFGLVALFALDFALDLGIRSWFNTKEYALEKIDEHTKYQILKEVEDTCRAMQASYASDKLMYESYKETHPDWAEQAKIRANKTAITYNEYMLKNNYVWKDNVPDDIMRELEVIG